MNIRVTLEKGRSNISSAVEKAASKAARAWLEREIHVTNEAIGALVYKLYGLTGEEIKLVEGA